MKKRLLSFAVVMAMASALVPVIGSAEEVDVTDAQLGIEAESFEYEQKILEDERQSSDRFIVKYKDSAQSDRENVVASSQNIFRQLREEKQQRRNEWEKHISAENLERLQLDQNTRKAKAYSVREVDTNQLSEEQPKVETIELAESVNAEQFVSEMEQTMGDKIEYIQPDVKMETSSIDPSSLVSAVVDREINLSQALETATGAGVTVALIDSGVDVTHEGLQNNLVTGWDFFNDKELTYSEEESSNSMHGTHIAGIIAQTAPEAKIMPLKVFQDGKAYTSDIIRAIEYAEANGADVVNCSWGNSAENPALKEVMENSDMFFVAAVGNGRINLDETPVYPASYGLDNIINVTSVNQDGGMSYYSNYGESVDIAAWGRDVYSTMPNNEHGKMTGTSMSAGYVTGAAALALSNGTEISELKYVLRSGADKASSLDGKVENGNMLNFANTVYGVAPQEATYVNYEDDFDRWTEKTPEENWQLFNSSKTVQVSAGVDYTTALKEDGTVWAWGKNRSYQLGNGTKREESVPKQVPGLTNIKYISAGNSHSAAVTADGKMYTWGNNQSGQLGDGTTLSSALPVLINELETVEYAKPGYLCTVALLTDGTVYTWGENSNGQLGHGTYVAKYTTPKYVQELSDVKAIATNSMGILSHTLVLKKDGTVWAWGSNSDGKLGNGTTTDSSVPVRVSGLENVKAIATGSSHSLALKEDGTVFAWGANSSYELGNPTMTMSKIPVKIEELSNIESVSVGARSTIAINGEGLFYVWGSNSSGQLGDGTTVSKTRPTLLSGIADIKAVSIGDSHTVALKEDGTVYAWGSNRASQLGDGRRPSGSMPKQINIPAKAKSVSSFGSNTAVVDENGTVYTWGNGIDTLRTGIKDKTYNAPVALERMSGITALAFGNDHAIALKEDGKAYAWGSNKSGQAGTGTQYDALGYSVQGMSEVQAVAAGVSHSLALKKDGTVWTWGYNGYGQLGNGTTTNSNIPVQVSGLEDVKAIAAGEGHTVALKKDGTVWAWGLNMSGILGIEDNSEFSVTTPLAVKDLTNIKGIAAGSQYTLALNEYGEVYAWGSNSNGELGNGVVGRTQRNPEKISSLANIKSISAGTGFASAVDVNGAVYTWGSNNSGQLGDGGHVYSLAPYEVESLYNNDDTPADLTGIWVEGDKMPYSKYSHNLVEYKGKIYTAGMVYDIKNNSWSVLENPGGTGMSSPISLYMGKIYSIYSDKTVIYDINTNTWSLGSSKPNSAESPQNITLHDGKIYAIGDSHTGTSYIYDIESDTWSEMESLPICNVNMPKSIVYNNKIYIIGGTQLSISSGDSTGVYNSATVNTVYIYDIANNTWSEGASMRDDRCDFEPVLVNGKIYVAGGNKIKYPGNTGSVIPVGSMEVYDIASDSWTTSASQGFRPLYSAVEAYNKIYYIGGAISSGADESVRVYNLETGSVEYANSMRYPRNAHASIYYNGKIYTTGSNYSVSNSNKTMEIYTIEELPDIVYGDEIISVDPIPDIEVEHGTPVSALNLPPQVMVILDNGNERPLNVKSWDTSTYNPEQAGEYTIYGDIELIDGIINPYGKRAEVKVTVAEAKKGIISIEKQEITSKQGLPLGVGGKYHELDGIATTADVPATAIALLSDGTERELEVTWDDSSFNQFEATTQTIKGSVTLPDGIINPDNAEAELDVIVTPAIYFPDNINVREISINVIPGTTIEEIDERLKSTTIHVTALDLENMMIESIYSDCKIDREAEENKAFDSSVIGTTQTLKGRLNDIFVGTHEDWDGFDYTENLYIDIIVNIVEAEIVDVPSVAINAYQSLELTDSHNDELPKQVSVELENGMGSVMVDVNWHVAEYDKQCVPYSIISGDLVNLPNGVLQPEEVKKATLIVNVQQVNYIATITDPNYFLFADEPIYAGYTLKELNSILAEGERNLYLVEITSVTPGIEITAEYNMPFVFEEDKNPDYCADEVTIYAMCPTFLPPDNIDCETANEDVIFMQTLSVDIESIEMAVATTTMGTAFEDVVKPSKVWVTLIDGRKKWLEVDWGAGEGYLSDSDELTEDNPITSTVYGDIINKPDYIDIWDTTPKPELKITVMLPKIYQIESISPEKIPSEGVMKVNYGASLEEIYDELEIHSVTVEVVNLKGGPLTLEIPFKLRSEDNQGYNPESESEYDLVAYLELEDYIKNDKGVQLVISVRPTKYVIKTGGIVTVGNVTKDTTFEELNLPEKAPAVYTDGTKGNVPATWDRAMYKPETEKSHTVRGTYQETPYAANPNKRYPMAAITMVKTNAMILTATPVTEKARMRSRAMSSVTEEEREILREGGIITRDYIVTLQYDDGRIETDVMTVFVEATEEEE